MKLNIEVTQEDIEQGKPGSYWCCPVALALSRSIGDKAEVRDIGLLACTLFRDGRMVAKSLPTEVRKFVKEFDQGKPVRPFSFRLGIPRHYLPPNAAESP